MGLVRVPEDGGCPQALVYGVVCPQGRWSHVCSPVPVVLCQARIPTAIDAVLSVQS